MTGTVYWITGLAGSGKTTIGKLLYSDFKKQSNDIVYLDGDNLRKIFGDNKEFSIEGRKNLAMQYSELCKMLSEQNIDVICTTISMFEDVQKSNRENITNYLEVYIKVPIEVLISRDQKGLYSRAINGEIKNVMGIDLDVEEPKNPDVVINNDGNNSPMKVLEELKIGIHNLQNIK